jgi:uncharacterized RDD family membrane protein YckC
MASADYSVLTPERVSLEYGIAGIGSRGAAAVVDTALQAVALCVLIVGVVSAGVAAAGILGDVGANARYGLLIGVFFLGTFVVTSGYFMLFEILWSGQTPGKRLVGLRVIRESGYPIRPVDAVIRNLVRIVDWLPLFYGVGVLVMLFNRRSRRLGDFASGTIVVREGARRAFAFQPTATAAEPRGYTLSSTDATLVRDFLVRRGSMHPSARADLARRLASALSQRYHLPLDADAGPEHFLERLT